MALQQIIQHETGAASHYWRVGSTDLNYAQKTASITLLGVVAQSEKYHRLIQAKQPVW